jgi:hypothetical protein
VVLRLVQHDGALRAARHRDSRREQPVVGSDEHALTTGDLDGDGAARRADTGIDDREDHAGVDVLDGARQGERTGADVVRRDAVGDVDDRRVRGDGPDDRLADADELVVEAVVGEERDGRVPRRQGAPLNRLR